MNRNLEKAIKIIQEYEGLRDGDPTSIRLDPYLCPAGYWTIGWGHVVLDPTGKQMRGPESKQRAREVYPQGLSLTEAEVLLADDVRRFAAGIFRAVKVELNDNQFCALVSFAFNVGFGAFSRSTLLKELNRGQLSRIPLQLRRWNKIAGKESTGLTRRREAEILLWEKLP